jgi:hypothetical protein
MMPLELGYMGGHGKSDTKMEVGERFPRMFQHGSRDQRRATYIKNLPPAGFCTVWHWHDVSTNLSHLETPKTRSSQGDWYWTDFTEDGRRYRRPLPVKKWDTAWRNLGAKARMPKLRLHDPHHTIITELAKAGGPEHVMESSGSICRAECWSIIPT